MIIRGLYAILFNRDYFSNLGLRLLFIYVKYFSLLMIYSYSFLMTGFLWVLLLLNKRLVIWIISGHKRGPGFYTFTSYTFWLIILINIFRFFNLRGIWLLLSRWYWDLVLVRIKLMIKIDMLFLVIKMRNIVLRLIVEIRISDIFNKTI